MVEPEQPVPVTGDVGTPTVIVSHLDVKYTVYGGGRRGLPSGQDGTSSFLQRVRARPAPKVREIHAVKDVSFVARHGESIGIIGRNGSGKSTLLRAVAGLIPPSAGRLWVSGEPSLLGVNAVLMSKLSGERNIYIGAQALGLSKAEIATRFDDIVEFAGIGDAVYLPMSTYSSGMGARLRFAISTAAAPDVLMIDEALATGDADFRAKSAERIAEIRQQAGTVFLVSHSNSSIREICNRVMWLEQGQLIMDGATDEVMSAYEATLPKKAKRKKAPPPDPDVPGTTRVAGTHPVQIAAALTRRAFEPGVSGCFVVSVHRLAAARLVAPAAAQRGWPLLWVRPGSIPTTTHDELNRLQPKRVVVVGGDELISSETYSRIEELCTGSVERIGADGSALTSADVLRHFPPRDPSTVHITPAHSSVLPPTVSLAAAVAGQAVIAGDPGDLPDDLITAVADVQPRRLLFAGDADEWPAAVVERLKAATGAQIDFWGAEGPMAMSTGLWGETPPGGEVIVTGRSPVELLTAAVTAVHTGAAHVLFAAHFVPPLIQESITRLAPCHIVLAGTPEALNADVRRSLGALVTARVGHE